MTHAQPSTLLDLIRRVPADRTAIIVPEGPIRITYGALARQVEDVANALTALGVGPGDRVGSALPNGLSTVVCFLAASMAGTAAPLNPAYREEEFKFYLEDTNAKVLLVPAEGADAARKAAGDSIPVITVSMDVHGTV